MSGRMRLSDEIKVFEKEFPYPAKTSELMERLGIDRAIVAGASFGGFMAQLIAKRHLEKVVGIGLFSTAALTENTIRNGRKKYQYCAAIRNLCV